LELTLGQIKKFTQASGKIITCMDRGYLLGLMAEDTRVNIIMTRKMDLVSTLGRMGDSMLASGKMVSSMDKVYTKM
jgi:hypothetical protein